MRRGPSVRRYKLSVLLSFRGRESNLETTSFYLFVSIFARPIPGIRTPTGVGTMYYFAHLLWRNSKMNRRHRELKSVATEAERVELHLEIILREAARDRTKIQERLFQRFQLEFADCRELILCHADNNRCYYFKNRPISENFVVAHASELSHGFWQR